MIGLIVNSRKIYIERQAKPGILYFITKKSHLKYEIYFWFSEKKYNFYDRTKSDKPEIIVVVRIFSNIGGVQINV